MDKRDPKRNTVWHNRNTIFHPLDWQTSNIRSHSEVRVEDEGLISHSDMGVSTQAVWVT